MSVFYGIACLLSLILLVIYFFVDKKREKWLMLLFISIAVCNTGYFLLSISQTLTFGLISNSIAYVGNVFLPFFMLMLILDACNIKLSKRVIYTLLSIGGIILFIATTGGYLPIYYKEVSLEITESGSILVKEYGPLHILYFFYLFGYMGSMVTFIIYAITKKKLVSNMQSIFLSVIVFGNILVWLIEQFVDNNFEFLCISYILNELLLLLFYGMLRELENLKKKALNELVGAIEYNEFLTDKQVAVVFNKWNEINLLTNREKEILSLVLRGEKRKSIAEKLFISDNSVRNHINSVFKKLNVKDRKDLCESARKII